MSEINNTFITYRKHVSSHEGHIVLQMDRTALLLCFWRLQLDIVQLFPTGWLNAFHDQVTWNEPTRFSDFQTWNRYSDCRSIWCRHRRRCTSQVSPRERSHQFYAESTKSHFLSWNGNYVGDFEYYSTKLKSISYFNFRIEFNGISLKPSDCWIFILRVKASSSMPGGTSLWNSLC